MASKSNVLVNTRDRLGRTALLVALMSGAGPDTVRELITAGERLDTEAGRNLKYFPIFFLINIEKLPKKRWPFIQNSPPPLPSNTNSFSPPARRTMLGGPQARLPSSTARPRWWRSSSQPAGANRFSQQTRSGKQNIFHFQILSAIKLFILFIFSDVHDISYT